jgi:hypothetical protein
MYPAMCGPQTLLDGLFHGVILHLNSAQDMQLNQERLKMQFDRTRALMPLLLHGVQVIVVPVQEEWIAQGRELDVCAQGPSRTQAVASFRRLFAADILTQAEVRSVLHAPCPDSVWQDLVGRHGAELIHVSLGVTGLSHRA